MNIVAFFLHFGQPIYNCENCLQLIDILQNELSRKKHTKVLYIYIYAL